MHSSSDNRDFRLDALRCASMLGVVAIHVYAFMKENFYGNSLTFMAGYIQISNFAVPVFFIISGFIVTERLRNIDKKHGFKYISKKAWRGYKLYFIWSLVFLCFNNRFNPKMMYWAAARTSLAKLLLGPGFNAHLWFLPVLSVGYFAIYISNKYYRNRLWCIFVMILYIACLLVGYYKEAFNWIPNSINNNYIGGISFCLLGVLFAYNKDKITTRSELLIFTMCIGLTLTILESMYFLNTKQILRADFLIGTFFYSAGIFWLPTIFKDFLKPFKDILTDFAKLMLGVYLVHPLVIHYIGPQFKESLVSFNHPFIIFHFLYIFTILISMLIVKGLIGTRFSWIL